MTSSGSRWNQRVLDLKMSRAITLASGDRFMQELDDALDHISSDVRTQILASGRGGSQRADFANYQHAVTRSAKGRYTARLGWLQYPGTAREMGSGGKLWYQYHNWGFQLFGGPYRVAGLGFLDGVEERFKSEVERVARNYVNDIAGVF